MYGSGKGGGGFRFMAIWYIIMMAILFAAMWCAFNGASPAGASIRFVLTIGG